MTAPRPVTPADFAYERDEEVCNVAHCATAVGPFVNGDDEQGYRDDFADGYVVIVDDEPVYFCAWHHDVAVAFAEENSE